ncbi:GspE/PulE family protein [Rubrivivax gelatinosus]|uniref:General secretion pathway protein E n=1 Tax=Rubrivivax gelatinosus TaxID=28068 RepID=A0A4R2MAE1_RUBGE|nr:GspE/PulE family protein [Rubrivivax gelatinosus]MBK1687797.1 hypothetical protein [Rubrivivax gelatinosus]TCP03420.1 general secretion pathway protein E [Rubrivivax gelatinosus]
MNQVVGLELGSRLNSVRAQSKEEGKCLLDLLRNCVPDRAALKTTLEEAAGIVLLEDLGGDPEGFRLDEKTWPLSRALETRSALLKQSDGVYVLALEDPWVGGVLEIIAESLGAWPRVALADRQQIDRLLGQVGVESSRMGAVGDGGGGPVVSFVDDAMRNGFRSGASDLHFECGRDGVIVRVRMDGVLTALARLNGSELARQVISRIKVLAALDITERRTPQDGRIRLNVDGSEIDLRVSIMPSVHGEDAVLRLLDKAQWRAQSVVSLDTLGFQADAARSIRSLAFSPSGMLLVTGPTGSGKTTTVYAALSEINNGLEKIITIEDPVEYELPGVLQIPVNERKGLTFARGLRSILRHDPDRILIGEIRDAETAEIAVQSALTGHQVFTTVHANGVGDVIGRFRHFGIDMFGLMSALNGVVVQRLLRQVCPDCAEPRRVDDNTTYLAHTVGCSLIEELHGKGCDSCRGTGYKGRFVVAEIHVMDDELRDLVVTGAPLSALRAHSVRRNVRGLLAQGLAHVSDGRTTATEVERVIGGAA